MITLIPFRVDFHRAVTKEFRIIDDILMNYYNMTFGLGPRETVAIMAIMGGTKRRSRDDLRELLK